MRRKLLNKLIPLTTAAAVAFAAFPMSASAYTAKQHWDVSYVLNGAPGSTYSHNKTIPISKLHKYQTKCDKIGGSNDRYFKVDLAGQEKYNITRTGYSSVKKVNVSGDTLRVKISAYGESSSYGNGSVGHA